LAFSLTFCSVDCIATTHSDQLRVTKRICLAVAHATVTLLRRLSTK
jgi:hypothetical protein